ncbi:MAG: hypothetical protein ACK4P2_06235, partial [Hyphomonas sp.]
VRDLLVMGALMSLVAFLTLTPDLVAQFSLIADITVYVFLLIYALSSAAVVKFAGGIERADLRWAARGIGVFGAAASAWVAWAAFTA